MGFARTTPSDYPCQLLRSGRLLPVGRSPTSNGSGMGNRRCCRARSNGKRTLFAKTSLPLGRWPPPTPEHANLDWSAMGCVDVGAYSKSDSAFGCRQMVGNVWECGPVPPSAPIPALRLTLTRNTLNRGLKPATYYVAAAGQPVRASSVIHGETSILQIGGMS